MSEKSTPNQRQQDLPTGTVTFLFTDVQGSTKLVKTLGEDYVALMNDHHRIMREVISRRHGTEVRTQGDSFFVTFPRANDAVAAVVDMQRALYTYTGPQGATLQVRMGLHTGQPWVAVDDYEGLDIHRAARIAATGHGGQVLLSETTTALVRDDLPEEVSLKDLGVHRLKDMRRPEQITQLIISGLPSDFPAIKSLDFKPLPALRGSIRGYELQQPLGKGVFGEVFLARQPSVHRDVAIKTILPGFADNPDFIRRFETEAQLVAGLEHPYIVPLYDYWREPGGAYLVMRYLRAGSLEEALTFGPWQGEYAAKLVEQVSAGLAYAHRQGVVHRDIKPANILLDESGNAYLTDFGIATLAGSFLSQVELGLDEEQKEYYSGSLGYQSPEVASGDPVTQLSDIYSLGVVLYQLVTARKPFPNLSGDELIEAHRTMPIPSVLELRPELPPGVDDVIQKATAKDPTRRYKNASQLAAAFKQVILAEALEAPLEMPLEVENPYKGLRAFQEADAGEFFGREAMIQRLLRHFEQEEGDPSSGRFLSVVGPSGSGKSSLVRAGLVPALRKGAVHGSNRWFIVDMIPGPHPFEELEAALLRVAVNPPESLLSQLQEDERGLIRAVKRCLPPEDEIELLLVVDQFEELFTLVSDETVRSNFLACLLTAVLEPRSRLRVVITLRADLTDRPLQYVDFGELVRERTEFVLPLTPEELDMAITGPAKLAGLVPEPGLVNRIIHDVSDQPGTLPLLQYALTELFERRTGSRLTLAAYEESGGVLGALGRRAEEIFTSLDEAGQEATRQTFLRLVTLGEGVEDTRRRLLRQELESLFKEQDSNASQVIDIFGKARLLSFDHDPATRSPTVEVAHEALLREWHRLRGWLDESRADIRMQVVLSNATADWLEGGEESSYLLRGSRLAQFEVWSDETSLALTPDERRFLETSQEFEAQRNAQQAALERRSRNFLRALVVVFALAAVVAVGLTIFAFNQRGIAQDNAATAQAEAFARGTQQVIAESEAEQRATQQAVAEEETDARATQQSIAEEQRAIAEEQQVIRAREAEVNHSLFLGSQSQIALEAENLDLALALAWAATQIDDPPGEAQTALSEVAYAPGNVRLFSGHDVEKRVFAALFIPERNTLLSASTDNTIREWDLQTGQEIRQVDIQEGQMARWAVAFSPDGRQALVGLEDQSIILLDTETGEVIHRLRGHTSDILTVAFSPDGRLALSGSGVGDRAENTYIIDIPPDADLSMRLWDLSTGEEIRRFEGHDNSVSDTAFGPDGRTAISGSYDGSLILWDLETGEILQRMVNADEDGGGFTRVTALAYSPDGRQALASSEFGVNLWDLETSLLIQNLGSFNSTVTKIAFSPNGDYGASVDLSGELRVWDLETGELVSNLKSVGQSELNFSPDGQYLIVGGVFDLGLWSLTNGAIVRQFSHEDALPDIAYGPDGRTAIAIERFEGLNLWDLQTENKLLHIDFPGPAQEVAYTPDGSSAVVTFLSGDVIQYDLSTGAEIKRFGGESEEDGHLDWVDGIAISPDSKTMLTGAQGAEGQSLFLWDLESGEQLKAFATEGVNSVAISPDGGTALTTGDELILWDLGSGEALHKFEGHDSPWDVAFSPDGKTALTASWDGTLTLWDLESGESIQRLLGHNDFVRSVAFHPDGRTAVSGSRDGTLILWDLETGEAIRRYHGHTDNVNSVEFSPSGQRVLSGGADGLMIEWRIDDTLEYLVSWIEANRYIPELTCSEREQFNIEPLCE